MDDPAMAANACWCGNDRLENFSPGYFKCPRCETLVSARMPPGDVTSVDAGEAGLYGKEYWFSYQEKDVGYPNIVARARTDLPERCVHWLRTLLTYKPPPARTLELGAAHGGFVALLGLAGYESGGLELSPWIAQFARNTFRVPMMQGPVERQLIEPATLDALILMDVAEHLPDPLATLSHCLRLLTRDGVMLVQTPAVPEGKSFEQMQADADPFLHQLKPDEHLYLFSRRAARELLERIGCRDVRFEPAIFAQYDQFLIASAGTLTQHTPAEVRAALEATPGGRLAGALLDAAEQRDYFAGECAARLKVIEALDAEVKRLGASER
jgi:SAM-dependent methyltransferase